ncbi:MAG: hypothetical protein AB8I58_06060 [Anaerolineales bacterium]|jgi:hypothetical protein
MIQNFASTTLVQNPGYEYLMGVYWMKEAQVSLSSEKTRYYLPAKALVRACLAIDSYINVVGSKVDPHWDTLHEESIPLQERLTRIYQNLNWPLDLNKGIWEDVLVLFGLRDELSRFELTNIYGMPETEVPQIFKEIEQRYPIRLTHAIAEEAIQLLINISG